MKTIKHVSESTIKAAYQAPESEVLEINLSAAVLQASGGGGGNDWEDEGDD
ncbi:MAG: hypothetical protein J6T04_07170 [Bacteroidales bacterium]|nr:hypothetical protein [Bacteroidales bacterium]